MSFRAPSHNYRAILQHHGITVTANAETKRKALAKAVERYAENRGVQPEWIVVVTMLARQVIAEWRGREHIGALSVSEGRSFARIDKF